jgi:tetratricopeptide (TPR) repeat protein
VYLGLYDVGKPQALRVAEDEVPADPVQASLAYTRLAESLLLRGSSPDSIAGGTESRSLPAVQSVIKGQSALAAWDLKAADRSFQRAIYYDTNYARANLLSAQVRAWQQRPRLTWATLAARAEFRGNQLDGRNKLLANSLALLGRGDFQKACDSYAALVRLYPNDFAGHFGLGQCRSLDLTVVPDSTSPSGWRYRSSIGRAMEEFKVAFELLPAFTTTYQGGAFERLRNLLMVSNDIFPGFVHGAHGDSTMYYSLPGWINDSLAMIPYRWDLIFAGDSSSTPPGYKKALAKRRTDFREIADRWLSTYPDNAKAQHFFAIALEQLQDPAAIDTLHVARARESDPAIKRSLAAGEVVLLVKFGLPGDVALLRHARALADSLLREGVPQTISGSEALAPVYALMGRCNELDSAGRQRTQGGPSNGMGASLLAEGIVLASRIAVGCPPRDVTIESVSASIERNFSKADKNERQRVDEMLLYRPVLQAPLLDRSTTRRLAQGTRDDLLKAAAAAAAGDIANERALLLKVDRRNDPRPPTPDISLARARLWLHAGDSVRATRVLDAALSVVRSYDPEVLTDPVNAGALLQEMLLRAQLAAKGGDRTTTQRWRTAVQILWSNADDNLKREAEIRTH